MPESACSSSAVVDVRYVGQGHELRSRCPTARSTQDALHRVRGGFEAAYERIYGVTMPGAGRRGRDLVGDGQHRAGVGAAGRAAPAPGAAPAPIARARQV